MHALVTGGTGLIGSGVVPLLADAGHEVTVVSRSPDEARKKFASRAKACSIDALPATFDAVINLAGSPIDKRWTDAVKRDLRESRIEYTRRIREQAEQRGASVFISASGINYYGDCADETLTEVSGAGDGFLSQVCVDWEAAAQSEKMRVAVLRTSMVLHPDGGALARMVPPFKMCLGGRLWHGRQWWSWILRDEVAGIYKWALENEQVAGPINATSPNPVTNIEFTKALGRALGRPTPFPLPKLALRVMFGEMANILLHSQRALPARTLQLGYQFKHPDLDEALKFSME